MVRFICPSDPKKATVGFRLKSALRIFSSFNTWKAIDERHEELKKDKLKIEDAQKKVNSLKVTKSKQISKDPPKPFNQTGLLFKRNKQGDSKSRYLRRESWTDNVKEMKSMSVERVRYIHGKMWNKTVQSDSSPDKKSQE